MFVASAALQIHNHPGQIDAGLVAHDGRDQIHQRAQRLPALTRLGALGLSRRQPDLHKRCLSDSDWVVGQVGAASCAMQRAGGFNDFLPMKKAISPADLVDNAGISQCFFKDCGLEIGAI